MTVEFNPKSKSCYCFSVPNGTWFHLLKTSIIKEILNNTPLTNDPIYATKQQAIKCAEAVKNWQPTEFWFGSDPEKGKQMFIEFFERCNGFETY